MARLFSYVVDHDLGYAPCPFGGFCSLAKCKYGEGRRNIVELADVGDWIAGTGGADLNKSAGHGRLIYAMRVDEKIPLAEYCKAHVRHRIDARHDLGVRGRFALISRHFFYFGRNAVSVAEIPRRHLRHRFEKRGPGHRSDFSEDFIEDFARWLTVTFKVGVRGNPCLPDDRLDLSECPSLVKRKTKCR